MGVRARWAARELAAVRDSEAAGRIRASVRVAARLGTTLVGVVVGAVRDQVVVDAALAVWERDLASMLVDAAVRSHLQAHVDALNEVAEVIGSRPVVPGETLWASEVVPYGSQDPTARAVQFLRARLALSTEEVEGLRDVYGRLATEIALPMRQNAARSVHEAMARVVEGNLARDGAEREIAASLAGVTGVSPHTVETLFRTQHQMAYSAGAWVADQDAAIAEILWGYEYVTVGDDRVRANHQALDGVRLPKDDPRWATIRPPNGYNCRCQILRVFDTDDHSVVAPEPVDIGGVPVVPGVDPGFGFNPGAVYRDALNIERRALQAAREERRRAASEAAAAQVKAKAPLVDADGWPLVLSSLLEGKPLGGSTGARLVTLESGERYVLKRGASAEHVNEEAEALSAYRALGVPVPEARLYQDEKGPVLLTKWVDGVPLGSLSGEARERAEALLREGFGADALLGNWDVVGMGGDNVLVRPDGVPVRVDVGGSLRFRAQGAPKGDKFGSVPSELWSLRDPKVNADAARVFGRLGWGEVVGSLDALAGRERAVLASVRAPELREVLRARLDEMREVAAVSRPMLADAFKPGYVERVAFHTAGLRGAGFARLLPRSLAPTTNVGARVDPTSSDDVVSKWSGQLTDQDGNAWDHLRGKGKQRVSGALHEYLESAVGRGSGQAVFMYHRQQAGDSWRAEPRAVKQTLVAQRNVPASAYFDREPAGDSVSRDVAKIMKDPAMVERVAVMQAANMQVLRHVELPNVDRARGRVWACRTEDARVIDAYPEVAPGYRVLQRGAAESFSLLKPVYVNGTVATWQYLPVHRVVTGYWWGNVDTWLCGDAENEIVAMGEGIVSRVLPKGRAGADFMAPPGGDWPPPGVSAGAPAAPKKRTRRRAAGG